MTSEPVQAWLKARQYLPVDSFEWDSPEYEVYKLRATGSYLHICTDIFGKTGTLKAYTRAEWKDEWVFLQQAGDLTNPDDLPF